MKLSSSNRKTGLFRRNLRLAQGQWGCVLNAAAKHALRTYSEQLSMAINTGDLLLIDGKWYVTHSGLLHLANRRRCRGIEVTAVPQLCDPASSRWVFRATAYKSSTCKGFVGHGDADPSNVSPLVRGAEMRVAETRAVNRALRKAYGIGICSVEELGSFSGPGSPVAQMRKPTATTESANGNGHHPLRDRLCLLIRQHHLDATLVKAYAADCCDVSELRLASRQQIAAFIKHLADYAQSDREGLLCQLNGYASKPVTSAVTAEPDTGEAEKAGAA